MASLSSPVNKRPSLSSLRGVSYEETIAAKPPVPIATASSPYPSSPDGTQQHQHAPKQLNASTQRPMTSPKPIPPRFDKDMRRDSGLAPSNSTARDSRASVDDQSAASLKSPPSIPSIIVDEEPLPPSSRRSEKAWDGLRGRKTLRTIEAERPSTAGAAPFRGITMDIPTASFEDLTADTMQFSKRGSVLLKGQKASDTKSAFATTRRTGTKRVKPSSSLMVRQTSTRALSADEELLSRRVRLMYDKGEEDVSDSEVNQLTVRENGTLWEEEATTENESSDGVSTTLVASPTDAQTNGVVDQADERRARRASFIRKEGELAGGLEDWKDVEGGDVDRYGFIIPRRPTGDSDGHEPQPIQRVTTSLQLASEAPRRRLTLRRSPSNATNNSVMSGRSPSRKPSQQSARPTSSQSSYRSTQSRTGSTIRYAANRLPHNRNRKFVDEAGDMLTLPFGLSDAADADSGSTKLSRHMKKKEWEREDKWRKMAKLTSKSKAGGGMTFEFDTTSSKLIERTWKGIPDRWRATAWHAFLSASAKKHPNSPTDEELIQTFNDYQEMGSPDDIQIDIDVPRTISSHIMFRRRYRGGQRLLFRVLHAMSLYFPETGYVQGMAALAATLLAYYDEEHAFLMLVRLWQLRGLDRLYRSGFTGLMEALDDFEKGWLAGGEVAEQLTELGIPPTAYGTRWYLTLFNYSIPFPAQLRVWDVFMLLGDAGEISPSRPPTSTMPQPDAIQPSASPFGKSLDVLHATSAALIDGMRDIIMDSDFENGMKVLTSWVPIKDVELFMRVARAEWKVHHRKKG
ncbi:hypothetical protein FQN54_000035 [Arachnomyces sp. PD_36]|nr:hypothetical protein FQN54_000035 [Arachnomyces sp. PD_36]